jgi:hypothetical protein
VVAIHASQVTERDDVIDALWQNLAHSDQDSYPAEMLVRDAAGRALFASLLRKRLP